MSFPSNHPSKQDFEDFHYKKDPWSTGRLDFHELVRGEIIKRVLKSLLEVTQRSKHLDIGSGEGSLLSRVKFCRQTIGLEISTRAIARAKLLDPDIKYFEVPSNKIGRAHV